MTSKILKIIKIISISDFLRIKIGHYCICGNFKKVFFVRKVCSLWKLSKYSHALKAVFSFNRFKEWTCRSIKVVWATQHFDKSRKVLKTQQLSFFRFHENPEFGCNTIILEELKVNVLFNPWPSGEFDLRARQTIKNVSFPGIIKNDQRFNSKLK